MSKFIIVTGTIAAAMGIAAGAFGSHALKDQLTPHFLEVFEVGVRYQLYHALALIVFGLWLKQSPTSNLPAWFFMIGIVLFSGSLYTLAITGITKFGAITPIGGGAFIVGWLYWAYLCYSRV